MAEAYFLPVAEASHAGATYTDMQIALQLVLHNA
jgi:hypothetical protein